MWHLVKDLSPDQRLALEGLLGRRLSEDEGLSVQPSRPWKKGFPDYILLGIVKIRVERSKPE